MVVPVQDTIKNKLNDCKITLVTSEKNYIYATSFNFFDDIIIYPSKNIFSKVKFILNLSKQKFDYVLILDGKDRSIIASLFIKSDKKVSLVSKNKLNFILKSLKIDFIEDDNSTSIIKLYQEVLNCCKINTNIGNYDFLKNKDNNNFSSQINVKNFVHIHLDEKWISKLYIEKYQDINPSFNNFVEFINEISRKNNVLITTGLVDFSLIDELKNKFFDKLNEKIYLKKNSNNIIYLIYKPSLADLESLIRESKIFISCHASMIHVANSFDIKIIDIIEQNKSEWYKRFTSYLNNYEKVYRNKFDILKFELLNKIRSFS